jgi:hypothetical protein
MDWRYYTVNGKQGTTSITGEKRMSGLWQEVASQAQSGERTAARPPRAERTMLEKTGSVHDLEAYAMRLSLLNQALWEILRDKLGMTDADLEQMAAAIDIRDGQPDGKISAVPVKCPACSRIINSKRLSCMYCTQELDQPIFG